MINVIVQNGIMSTSDSNSRLRRLIIGLFALVIIAVSIHLHPGSAGSGAPADFELTQVHQTDQEDGQERPHTHIHHDHHAELWLEADNAFARQSNGPDGVVYRANLQQVLLTFDRPPDAALC